MRFSKVAISYGGTSDFVFPLDSEIETAPYVVKSIDGLDPAQIDVFVSDSILDEGQYQGRSPLKKEIVLLMGFNPNYSIGETTAELRSRLYSLLTPKLGKTLTFKLLDDSSTVVGYISGMIKGFEANPFSKDPEVQITIPCFSPYFQLDRYTEPSPGTLNKNPIPMMNLGDAPTGFKLVLTFTTAYTSFQIENEDSSSAFHPVYNFAVGDILTINTHPRQRVCTVTRSGVVTNLLPVITPASEWLMLSGGLNNMPVVTGTGFNINEVSHIPRFWGV